MSDIITGLGTEKNPGLSSRPTGLQRPLLIIDCGFDGETGPQLPSAKVPIQIGKYDGYMVRYSCIMFRLDSTVIYINFVGDVPPDNSYMHHVFQTRCTRKTCPAWGKGHVPINCPKCVCVYCGQHGHWDHNCPELTRVIIGDI